MTESHPFSSSGEEAISRPVVLDSSEVQVAGHIPKSELAEYYEINRTSEEIISGDYKRVGEHIIIPKLILLLTLR